MRLKNIWPILLILWTFNLNISAKENQTEFMIDFRVNVMRIDSAYSGNAARMREIISYMRNLANDSSIDITSVAFCGAASPEGSYEWNRRLAAGRLSALENLIRSEVEIPDSIVSRDDSYIPWAYLRDQVADSRMPYRDTVISIIDRSPELTKDPDNGQFVDSRIPALKRLEKGTVWEDLLNRHFSRMRNASAVIITYSHERSRQTAFPAPLHNPALETQVTIDPALMNAPCSSRPRRPFHMAIYTNMLYDLLAIPNIGVEFYLGKDWSVAGNWMHAWWSNDNRHRYWRLYGGEINVRRWFGAAARRKPLTGHHIGVYAQAVTFDFEFGGKAYMGGEPGGTILDRAHFGAGFEYGYSLPVARRLNIDFSLGVGYLGGKIHEFVPDNGRYLWKATRNLNWFGPTKLEVSLVWLIGRGNVNDLSRGNTKGGAR